MELEAVIARVCAPALAGIKAANLVSIDQDKYPDACAQLTRLNRALGTRGIRMKIVCACSRRLLVLVYRIDRLEQTLRSPEIEALLTAFGYERHASLSQHLCRLRHRMREESFPHEIGAFLGYPVADIRGFLSHSRDGVKLVGEWKVYDNAADAAALFARFDACRKGVARRMRGGATLTDIFAA